MSLQRLYYQVEATAARFLIDLLLEEGMLVSIRNEEGYEIRNSQDRKAILEAMAATDIDCVSVRCPLEAKYLGVFMLVYGNGRGDELISDYSTNSFCDRIADAVSAKLRTANMYYEITVIRHHHEHFFATAERSIQDPRKLIEVYDGLSKAFPEPEYMLLVSQYQLTGKGVDINHIRKSLERED